jgi:beta-alanine--pyruvate transaminase
VFEQALSRGLLPRFTGETIALAPPFISTEDEIRNAVEILRTALRAAA